MIDIETMGNKSYSSIVSIGAVRFDIETGEIDSQTLYVNVNLQSCIDAGLILNADTIMWWMQQSQKARMKFTTDTVDLKLALESLQYFINKDDQVWGNSARFDLGILQNAYDTLKMPIPWDFRKERCVRTLLSFAPEIKDTVKNPEVAHDPIEDCKYQIAYSHEVWKLLKTK